MASEAVSIILNVQFCYKKGLISEEIKPFILRLVEISGIEPLTS